MNSHLWQRICGEVRDILPSQLAASLFSQVSLAETEGEDVRLLFPDSFSLENFERKCLPAVLDVAEKISGKRPAISLDIQNKSAPSQHTTTIEPDVVFPVFANQFDGKYKFENFVVGTSNQFAHAACMAVSKQPGQCYNPLFIFGGAGLGKTHLLRAIGHSLSAANPSIKILFLTSETFTNELIHAIRTDRMREFRDKYRTHCDVLLLDDVHFLAGKERTQEEFFYTFNYLHEARKQIVITSDRYPKDIQGLENRLQTRFEWGLVADVQPPEIETRIAILKNKAENDNIHLSNELAQFIAGQVTSNIRELEGSLHRLSAYASLTGCPITEQLARQVFRDITPKSRHELTPEAILKVVALQYGVRVTDLKTGKRTKEHTVPRQIAMYLLRRHLVMSYPEIGKYMGGKDHTTVLHAVTKVARLLRDDSEIVRSVTSIESLFR